MPQRKPSKDLKPLGSEFLNEIREQPEVISNFLEKQQKKVANIASRISSRGIRSVAIAARGTSDNAARYAKYVFGLQNRLPVALVAPSMTTVYGQMLDWRDWLMIGISQSGQSTDIVKAIEAGREAGALTLAITNEPNSPLAGVADETLLLEAGEERSIPATKTYTAQLAALALLSVELERDSIRRKALYQIPGCISHALELLPEVRHVANDWASSENCVVIGRGYNWSTAYEVALKLMEATYIFAVPFSTADFYHGPFVLADEQLHCLIISPKGALINDASELANRISKRGSSLAVITDQREMFPQSAMIIQIISGVEEWLTPLVAVVPGQLFAYELANVKSIDPDRPRGLQKITKTI